jgi:hypothetical protein
MGRQQPANVVASRSVVRCTGVRLVSEMRKIRDCQSDSGQRRFENPVPGLRMRPQIQDDRPAMISGGNLKKILNQGE